MNRRAIAAIIRKDLTIVVQSKAVMIPIVTLPLVIFILLPTLVGLAGPALINLPGGQERFIAELPAGLRAALEGLSPAQQPVVLALVYQFAPLYLIVPLMVATAFAADSFAGEKERKTLEALIYSPASDRDLFTAKLLSAWLPAVAAGLFGFVVYTLASNLAAWGVMGRVFFPTWMWLVLVVWVMPAVAGMGLGVTVIVSSKVKSFQEAYVIGGVAVLPILVLLVGQIAGVVVFNVWLVLLLGLALWGLTAILLWYGSKTFARSELVAQL
jgi:ABC-type Na+ efflux pump permease subunit